MKNKLLLDTTRTIKQSIGKYMMLITIVLMGVAFFSGMLSLGVAMSESVDKYSDDYNLEDFRIYSNYGFDENDIEALNAVSENLKATGAYFLDAKVSFGDDNTGVYRLDSFDSSMMENQENAQENSGINQVDLIEGRYPSAPNEALAEVGSDLYETPKIGETVTVIQAGETIDDVLSHREFTIVGIGTSPNYLNKQKGVSTYNNLNLDSFLYVPKEAFITEYFTIAYVQSTKAKEVNSFSEDYETAISADRQKLEDFVNTQQNVRATDIFNEANAEYQDGVLEYNQGIEDLNQALKDGQEEINQGYEDIADGRNKVSSGLNELNSAKAQLEPLIAAGKADPTMLAQYQEIENQIAALNATTRELDNGEKELEEAQKELDDSKIEAEDELNSAASDLEEARVEIEDLEPGEWTILGRDKHYSFATYKDTVMQMEVIGLIFPIFFFLVAALVCLTTMTRMVDEQRGQIGILRALGYSRLKCSGKYLIYALSATFIGGILGAIVGIIVFPPVVYNTWGIVYNLPGLSYNFPIMNMLIAVVVFLLLMGLTTYSAIRSMTKEEPAFLMRPKSPPMGKRVFLERLKFIWKHLSFTTKVTARNIIRYKKRFFMTVIGIAGCTCLLVTGFGIRESVGDIGTMQYDELTLYDGVVSVSEDADNEAIATLSQDIESQNQGLRAISLNSYNSTVTFEEEEVVVYAQVYDDEAQLKEMNVVRERLSQDEFSLSEDSILISEKMSELLSAKVGDTITIESREGTAASVKVGGIFEKYVNHEIYLSKAQYETFFGEPSNYNGIQIKGDIDNEQVFDKVLAMENVSGIILNSDVVNSFDSITESMNIVVIVIIISAASLAFVVLGNLANINIGERKREIATLKVLGFWHRETKDYIFKEIMALTIVGIFFGVILGMFAHNFIITQVEMEFVMFLRVVGPIGIMYSVLLTLVFSVVINRVMLAKIRGINMIESLKSVE